MTVQEQFNLIANEYDENRRKFIPCFDDYYISSTDFAAKSLEKTPNLIFDLGSGTGLFPSFGSGIFRMRNMSLLTLPKKCLRWRKSVLKIFRM